jgi:hypothetical protein
VTDTDKERRLQKARDVYALADSLGVPMLTACRHIGMATSTPHRWLSGSEFEADHYARLRASILVEAERRGTLPDELHDELALTRGLAKRPGDRERAPMDVLRDIRRNVNELAEMVGGAK